MSETYTLGNGYKKEIKTMAPEHSSRMIDYDRGGGVFEAGAFFRWQHCFETITPRIEKRVAKLVVSPRVARLMQFLKYDDLLMTRLTLLLCN